MYSIFKRATILIQRMYVCETQEFYLSLNNCSDKKIDNIFLNILGRVNINYKNIT